MSGVSIRDVLHDQWQAAVYDRPDDRHVNNWIGVTLQLVITFGAVSFCSYLVLAVATGYTIPDLVAMTGGFGSALQLAVLAVDAANAALYTLFAVAFVKMCLRMRNRDRRGVGR